MKSVILNPYNFTVIHGRYQCHGTPYGFTLTVLENRHHVHELWYRFMRQEGYRVTRRGTTRAFFQPDLPGTRHVGIMVLPYTGLTVGTIAHECCHMAHEVAKRQGYRVEGNLEEAICQYTGDFTDTLVELFRKRKFKL